MLEKEQIEDKSTRTQKPFYHAPFGVIPSSILTTQTLARFKFENKNDSRLHEVQKKITGLHRKFI